MESDVASHIDLAQGYSIAYNIHDDSYYCLQGNESSKLHFSLGIEVYVDWDSMNHRRYKERFFEFVLKIPTPKKNSEPSNMLKLNTVLYLC